ncbi:hypothetical protein G9A89_023222 [Geosiphon pyriformis]|nr:hypothetical protein G9A89_023222 [Geosiphon pyriformis]
MEPVDSSADGSGIVLAELETWSNSNKKKACIKSMYSHGLLFKKPKNPGMAGGVVNLLAGPVLGNVLQTNSLECKMSWNSEMESENASISGMSNLENMTNIVAEEMSFMNSNNSETDDMVDDTTLKKMRMKTYVLGQLLKRPSFNNVNDIDDILELSSSKFGGSNQKPSTRSRVLVKRSFEPVKLFALDVELSAEVFTPSKFLGIIRSFFTSEISLNKTRDLAVKIVIKKILVDLPKSAVESVFSKFGKIVLIKIQLIGLWQKALVEFKLFEIANLVVAKWFVFMEKNSVCVAKAIVNKQLWVFRNLHHALFYTLSVGMTAYNLSGLLELYGWKTCFISHNLSSYVHDRCVIVCFVDEVSKVVAIGSTLVFKGVNLHWAGLFLVCCARCKQFGHISDTCSVGRNSEICGKRVASIAHSVSFGSKTWAQVAGGSSSRVASSVHHSASLPLVAKTSLFSSASPDNHDLYGHLASLKRSLELLADQISSILKKLSFMELVLLAVTSDVFPPVVPVSVVSGLNSDMALDSVPVFSAPLSPVVNNAAADLSLSSFKILTTKVSGLESKMVALEVLVESVLEKLDYLCLSLGLSASSTSQ